MPKAPPTPTNIRRPKALPIDSDTEDYADNSVDGSTSNSPLPPLVLPSANGSLLNFHPQDSALSSLTASELYDMNQDLYTSSVPTRPLIASLAPISELRGEYENGSPAFLKEIDWLVGKGYTHIRRTRGDALGFAYIHRLLPSTPPNQIIRDIATATSLSLLASTPELLDAAGIEKMVYEDYYDVLKDLVERAGTGAGMSEEELVGVFQEAEYSNSVVLYLRFLTIRLKRDNYEGFLVHPDTKDPMDVDSFTANIVQAMGKEADNVEIDALSNALQLNLDLAYLNGVRTDGVDFIQFRNAQDKDEEPLVLLYRPGHYDILMKGTL